MLVAKNKYLQRKWKNGHNDFCLKVVTHPSTNHARPGLTSELVVSRRSSRLTVAVFSQTFSIFSRLCFHALCY